VVEDHRVHVVRTFSDDWGADPRCDECVGFWEGDEETGGCVTRLLAHEVLRLLAALAGEGEGE
jgi:hypothetical protein